MSGAKKKFVVPVTNIIESIRPDPSDVHRLPSGQELVAIRGEYVSLVYLYGVFNISGAESDPSKGLVVLAETEKKGVFAALETAANPVSNRTPYFASNQPRYTVAFSSYRIWFYNTTDKTVSVNLYAYLTD